MDEILIENERRFLLRHTTDFLLEIIKKKNNVFFIEQCYFIEDNKIKRLRKKFNTNKKEIEYEFINKENLSEGVNRETIYPIDNKIYHKKLCLADSKIVKTRYIIEENGNTFEIDLFDFKFEKELLKELKIDQLMLMEIELSDIKDDFEIPEWINSHIEKEITGDKNFSNYNLSETYYD